MQYIDYIHNSVQKCMVSALKHGLSGLKSALYVIFGVKVKTHDSLLWVGSDLPAQYLNRIYAAISGRSTVKLKAV